MLKRNPIPVLKPQAGGQQFLVYGDSCSGIAGALHEKNFQQVNESICALETAPQFICFLGDEIMGLTTDQAELRWQWWYFFERELAWLDRATIPLYHSTGNHTVYDGASEDVFREVMSHLPQNGPRGLSYFVRRGDLLMIFVNTMDQRCGGEGTVETKWLENVLRQHCDAKYKLVFGHHPVWAVNGYFGDYQRLIERETGRRFWDVLQRHNALAYFCSHILAFDVQVQAGILQICTAGAGTAHRMPPDEEYLHFLQAALDETGLRYQVVDCNGQAREWLSWNWKLPPSTSWATFEPASPQALPTDCLQLQDKAHLVIWDISLCLPPNDGNLPQTIFCATADGGALPNLWLGISGVDRRITVLLSPDANRSPHRWQGPALPADRQVSIQVGIHSGMGPGGLLWRWGDDHPWSSMAAASAWGAERLPWSRDWQVGECAGQHKFRGRDLRLEWHHQAFTFADYYSGHN